MGLKRGERRIETHGDENLVEKELQGSGRSVGWLPRWLPRESTTAGKQHSRASSLPTVKLKRGEKARNQRRAGGEKKAKGCLQGSFHAACFTIHQSRLLSRNRDAIQDKSGCYPRAPGTPLKGKF